MSPWQAFHLHTFPAKPLTNDHRHRPLIRLCTVHAHTAEDGNAEYQRRDCQASNHNDSSAAALRSVQQQCSACHSSPCTGVCTGVCTGACTKSWPVHTAAAASAAACSRNTAFSFGTSWAGPAPAHPKPPYFVRSTLPDLKCELGPLEARRHNLPRLHHASKVQGQACPAFGPAMVAYPTSTEQGMPPPS